MLSAQAKTFTSSPCCNFDKTDFGHRRDDVMIDRSMDNNVVKNDPCNRTTKLLSNNIIKGLAFTFLTVCQVVLIDSVSLWFLSTVFAFSYCTRSVSQHYNWIFWIVRLQYSIHRAAHYFFQKFPFRTDPPRLFLLLFNLAHTFKKV